MKQKPGVPLSVYWYQALSSPFGVEIVTSDPDNSRQKLYAVRRESRDEALKALSVCISPFDPNKLWIVKRTEDEAS